MSEYRDSRETSKEALIDSAEASGDNAAQVFFYRWTILILFIVSGVANAMILLTWAPITDKANDYWDGIGITAINLLNVIFQIMYLPGTLLALHISERSSDVILRHIVLSGGILTTVGCFIRLMGAVLRHQGITSAGSYVLVLLGTALVGAAQPFYLNLPAKIAATWFAVSERDVATTFASLANPLGSAIGSFLSPMFVASESAENEGIQELLLMQFIVAGSALVMVYFFFQDKPTVPPSASARTMQMQQAEKITNRMFKEVGKLFRNVEYVKLFCAFTVILGNLNALAALLNQLPGGYSNGEIGITGAVLIMSGFLGAFATGFVLDWSKAYRTVLKVSYAAAFVFSVFFLSNCRSNNFPLFIVSAGLLGFATLPTIPSTIVSTVECSYPAPEDASIGFLYIGANLMAIIMTFAGQVLLTISSSSMPAPFFPFGIWMATFLLIILVPIMLFKGQYFRLEEDRV